MLRPPQTSVHFPFSILHSPFCFHCPFSILHSQFSIVEILDSQFSILNCFELLQLLYRDRGNVCAAARQAPFPEPAGLKLIDGWQERGIPLHIVIRSIESVFDVYDQQPPGTRIDQKPFLLPRRDRVQYGEWLTSQTGKADEKEQTDSPAFSREVDCRAYRQRYSPLRKLRPLVCARTSTALITRLEELSRDLTDDPETVDKTLGDIEKLIDRSMLANWDKPQLKTFEKEIADQLRAYKSEMEPDVYKTTFELMLLKRLREEAGIPRLGLFYL